MPKAVPTPTTSRRGMLAAAGAASFATGFGALAALPDDRDAALLADLAEFDRLEGAMNSMGLLMVTAAAEEAHAPAYGALSARQRGLYHRIRATPAHTAAGITARARSLAAWAPDLLDPPPHRDGWDHHLMAALLRDLVRRPG